MRTDSGGWVFVGGKSGKGLHWLDSAAYLFHWNDSVLLALLLICSQPEVTKPFYSFSYKCLGVSS